MAGPSPAPNGAYNSPRPGYPAPPTAQSFQQPGYRPTTPMQPQPPQMQQPGQAFDYNGMNSRYQPTPGFQPSGPSYQPGGPGPGGMGGQPPMSQPQQRAQRLDPEQMPSAIQVMEEDKKTRSGEFVTNLKGAVPPLVTTPFVTKDQGNCGPRFIRSSMYNVPTLLDVMKQTAVPFSLVISPFAKLEAGEMTPPIVDMGPIGPVRCGRCKAYMCPYMQFIDGGRRFFCPFCKATTEVPNEYFQHLDHTGLRMDKFQRPELCLGTYEFLATKDYCRNSQFPKPPAYIFVIDVSYNNMKSGLVQLLCNNMRAVLQSLPCESGAAKPAAKVGFITYSSEVHFYNIKLGQPQMMVVGDVQDMFMPLLDGFLCEPAEALAVIDLLMAQIPAMFAESRETETILGPAIQAGLEALKAAECPGKLLVFHSSLPIAEAPGKLKNRDDRKLLGTDREKTILAPQTTFYNQLGQDCVGAGCSVELFVFNNAYIDLATIGQVARLSGGQVHKYTYFQAELDGERLLVDVRRTVEETVAFDTVMRVRTSTGVRPVDFYGHFFMSNTTDVEIAAVDSNQAVTVEIKHDDKLTDEDGVYIQVAILFTSVGGQRRLRVHNLSLNVCSQMGDLYRTCDLDTIMNLMLKQSVTKLTDATPKQIRDALVSRSTTILACYRKNVANPSSPGQLILPECMKLLPLYLNCLMNCDALSGGVDMTVDDRTFNMFAVQTLDVRASLAYLYPRMLPLHDVLAASAAGADSADDAELPPAVRCTIDKLRDDGVFVMDNGIHLFLWFGQHVSRDVLEQLFGPAVGGQSLADRITLPELDNPVSIKVRNIVAQVRATRRRFMRLTLVHQNDKLHAVFRNFLAEDRHSETRLSYLDILCHLHKEIRSVLN